MSGIAGCFYYTSQQSGLLGKKIHKMLKNLNAGERQETEFFTNNENVTFGYSNSNSVNTASMCEDNNYVVSFTGHLTNNKDLALLTGLSCDGSSKSAARIIKKLFQEKKDEIVYLLQGVYACIILEKEKKSLWILTDRGGFEFLYYYRDNKSFIFATEIRPILSVLDSPPEADFRSICEIYSFNTVFNTGTPFKNIKLMPHAAICSVNPENTTISQYWDYPIEVEHHDEDEEALLEKSKQLIQSAVDNALCGYDNIGVMLSGGLDSRLLASVAARNTDSVKAFTFEFGEEKTKDNLIAERIANQLNLGFFNVAPNIIHPIDEIEKCIIDTDGQWAFHDLLPYIRDIGKTHPGIALINGFLMDTLFKSGWAFFPGKFHGNLKETSACFSRGKSPSVS
jgi:asparagine synthetase B (glutamine-hydrolysing)